MIEKMFFPGYYSCFCDSYYTLSVRTASMNLVYVPIITQVCRIDRTVQTCNIFLYMCASEINPLWPGQFMHTCILPILLFT